MRGIYLPIDLAVLRNWITLWHRPSPSVSGTTSSTPSPPFAGITRNPALSKESNSASSWQPNWQKNRKISALFLVYSVSILVRNPKLQHLWERALTCYFVLLAADFRYDILPIGGNVGIWGTDWVWPMFWPIRGYQRVDKASRNGFMTFGICGKVDWKGLKSTG